MIDIKILTLSLCLAIFPLSIFANPVITNSTVTVSHSGGTDRCGCHYNRKTGEYHCHTRKQRGNGCPD